MRIEEKHICVVQACLDRIRIELDRLYYNKYQEPMYSPFDNTGEMYGNDTFVVRAYQWGEHEDKYIPPNFEYKGLKIWWYKHSNRGTNGQCNEMLTLDYLAQMIDDCFESMRKDFGEEE